jgi:hypothetical protein
MVASVNAHSKMPPMPLQETTIRSLKPRATPYKIGDEKGLFLFINPISQKNPTGSKLWRLKCRFGGKAHPEVPLKLARQKRDEARNLLQAGIDPAAMKQADKRTRKLEAQNASAFLGVSFVRASRERGSGTPSANPLWASGKGAHF